MSLDTPAPAPVATDDEDGGLLRQEGIQTVTRQLPAPAAHGGRFMAVLNDSHRSAREIPHPIENRSIPSGSSYQYARARYYAALDAEEVVTVQDSRGRDREYVVLAESYELEGTGETVAVTLNSSRCELGKVTESGSLRQYFKYNLTLKPLSDDGEIRWFSTPATSLNVTLRPQDDELARMVQDGVDQDWTPPFGNGTQVSLQTTWAEDPEEAYRRAWTLLEDALGYEVDELDVSSDSQRFFKSEYHYRVSEDRADELAHVLRQSSELLARYEGDIEETAIHERGRWRLLKLTTDAFGKLGMPILPGQDLELKLYLPDAPLETLEFPMDQPKLEISLAGRPRGGDAYNVERWPQIREILRTVLCAHLEWADVGADSLLEDEMAQGPEADLISWEHPEGRRAWLRDHYQSLTPQVYAEARKAQTRSVYDILHSIKRREMATYGEIADDVGLTKRTVRGHVQRLSGEDEEPGILETVPDAVTFVTFSSTFWEDEAHEALDRTYPNDTAEDRNRRADQRQEERLLKRKLGLTPGSSSSDEDLDEIDELQEDEELPEVVDEDEGDDLDEDESDELQEDDQDDSPTWQYFRDVELSADHLGQALERGYLAEDHVRVRTDASPLFGSG